MVPSRPLTDSSLICKLQARVSRERDERGGKETTQPAVTVLRPQPGPPHRMPATQAQEKLSLRPGLLLG